MNMNFLIFMAIVVTIAAPVLQAQVFNQAFAITTSNSRYTVDSGQPLHLSGNFSFTPETTPGVATVTITLNNPSTPNPIGMLTGFGFRLAAGLMYVEESYTGTSATDTNINFLNNDEDVIQPFAVSGLGFGDLGAGVTTGGGNPSQGLNAGHSGTFTLKLSGGTAGSTLGISADDFFTGLLPTLSGTPNDDEFDMIFRFQAITGSDNGNTSAKVGIALIPEPSTYAGIIGLIGFSVTMLRRTRWPAYVT